MSVAPKTPGDLVNGKYRIVRELGCGAMGRVFEAVHTGLDRRFALKFLRTSRGVEVATLEHEARAAGSIENEHIAAVTDFGIDGTPYLVMEYLEGEDLAALLERYEVLPVTRAVDLIVQACGGLRAAHARGIIHRDLKPANLFVTRRADGTDLLKVLDFGVATQVFAADRAIGTPRYMAPEQARGDGSIDERADVYALGVVLFECLSGSWPHDGETTDDVLAHLLDRAPTRLAELRADLPLALTRAVDRAVASKRERRFASVGAFAEALAPFAPKDDVAPVRVPMATMSRRARALFLAGALVTAGALVLAISRRDRPLQAAHAEQSAPVVASAAPSSVAAPAVTPTPAPEPAPIVVVARPSGPLAAPRPTTAPAPVLAPSSRFDRTNPY